MKTPTRTSRTAALSLWALRALAVVVVALVGASSSPSAHARAHLDVSSVVRSVAGAHDLAALASSARRLERRIVASSPGDRHAAHVGPALPSVGSVVDSASVRALPGAAPVAYVGTLAGRPHLSVVSARGPPVAV